MAQRGGKRAGAGRKVGSATKKTREIADRAAAEGVTPLEVMLDTMRELHEAGKKVEASAIAKDAAPYLHPKLQPVDGKTGSSEVRARVSVEFIGSNPAS